MGESEVRESDHMHEDDSKRNPGREGVSFHIFFKVLRTGGFTDPSVKEVYVGTLSSVSLKVA